MTINGIIKPGEARTWRQFAVQMMESRDIDPMYPVLADLNRQERIGPESERALWRSFVYVAFYHIGSSEIFMKYGGQGELSDAVLPPHLPTGIERRGLRSTAMMRAHLVDLLKHRDRWGSFRGWLNDALVEDDPYETWKRTRTLLENVAYNGRWASYKLAEILQKVHGWPLAPTDAGHRDSTGPLFGMRDLFGEACPVGNDNASINALDELTARLQADLWEYGIAADIAEVETLLCNWHSFKAGKYYVGHDIDEMLERVRGIREVSVRAGLFTARRRVLPGEYLGEAGDPPWNGIRKERMGKLFDVPRVVSLAPVGA